MTARVPQEKNTTNLYEQDYYLWLKNTAQLLRDDQLSELDKLNLIEELEDMGRSEKRAVKSNLIRVLQHLLKWKYQPEKRSDSWLSTIVEHRQRIILAFEDSPSLKGYYLEVFDKCYQDARKNAATETRLALTVFPTQSPFNPQDTLNPDYLPD
ncbi:DUF29 domain-containing protein [Pleurocapsales cyanobacterium LEGE 06147]|nr:DUF29 domain-containing protein [Pleurocapsales cyanobacterium LEGE 06147]